jgi:hypothetical protein
MKITALTLSVAFLVVLLFALVQNPSAARQDAFAPQNLSPASTSEAVTITEESPVQHVGVGENQPL